MVGEGPDEVWEGQLCQLVKNKRSSCRSEVERGSRMTGGRTSSRLGRGSMSGVLAETERRKEARCAKPAIWSGLVALAPASQPLSQPLSQPVESPYQHLSSIQSGQCWRLEPTGAAPKTSRPSAADRGQAAPESTKRPTTLAGWPVSGGSTCTETWGAACEMLGVGGIKWDFGKATFGHLEHDLKWPGQR